MNNQIKKLKFKLQNNSLNAYMTQKQSYKTNQNRAMQCNLQY